MARTRIYMTLKKEEKEEEVEQEEEEIREKENCKSDC